MDLKHGVKIPGDATVLHSCGINNTASLVNTITLKIIESNEWLCEVKGGWYEIVSGNDCQVAMV